MGKRGYADTCNARCTYLAELRVRIKELELTCKSQAAHIKGLDDELHGYRFGASGRRIKGKGENGELNKALSEHMEPPYVMR